MHDHMVLVDGQLEGRRFCLSATPTEPVDIAVAVSLDGAIVAVEGEPSPVNVLFRVVHYRYAPLMAKDGHQSRDDDGFLHFYAAAPQ